MWCQPITHIFRTTHLTSVGLGILPRGVIPITHTFRGTHLTLVDLCLLPISLEAVLFLVFALLSSGLYKGWYKSLLEPE